jgi:hypothetical protein
MFDQALTDRESCNFGGVTQRTSLAIMDFEAALGRLASMMPDRMTLRQAVAFTMIAKASFVTGSDKLGGPGITVSRIRATSAVGQSITRSLWTLEHAAWIERCPGHEEQRDKPYRLTSDGAAIWRSVLSADRPNR